MEKSIQYPRRDVVVYALTDDPGLLGVGDSLRPDEKSKKVQDIIYEHQCCAVFDIELLSRGQIRGSNSELIESMPFDEWRPVAIVRDGVLELEYGDTDYSGSRFNSEISHSPVWWINEGYRAIHIVRGKGPEEEDLDFQVDYIRPTPEDEE